MLYSLYRISLQNGGFIYMQRKKLQELTIKDNFMFGAVMAEPENCKELLLRGNDYPALPDPVVIFICDFDPFGTKKYRYTFRMRCDESSETDLQDGRCTIFLSTRGENDREVPKELVSFLKFVKADLEESQKDFQDAYVKKLQQFIGKVKESREMEERFMILEEMLREEHAEGRAEGRTDESRELLLQLLEELGEVPPQLRNRIQEEKDLNVLRKWVKTAAKAESVESFIRKTE